MKVSAHLMCVSATKIWDDISPQLQQIAAPAPALLLELRSQSPAKKVSGGGRIGGLQFWPVTSLVLFLSNRLLRKWGQLLNFLGYLHNDYNPVLCFAITEERNYRKPWRTKSCLVKKWYTNCYPEKHLLNRDRVGWSCLYCRLFIFLPFRAEKTVFVFLSQGDRFGCSDCHLQM